MPDFFAICGLVPKISEKIERTLNDIIFFAKMWGGFVSTSSAQSLTTSLVQHG